MNFSNTRYYTITARDAPAGRAARYQDAAAATEGPAVHHIGVQTVARASTLESASPTLSLRDSSSTEPTYVGVRNTPVRDASAAATAPAARPASPPAEDLEATSSRRAAPVDLRSSSVPAFYRLRKALMPAAASRGPRGSSHAPAAFRRSNRAPYVQRISAPAHAKSQAKRQAKREAKREAKHQAGMDSEDSDTDEESDGDDTIGDYERREPDDRERRNAVDEAWNRAVDGTDVDHADLPPLPDEYPDSEPDTSYGVPDGFEGGSDFWESESNDEPTGDGASTEPTSAGPGSPQDAIKVDAENDDAMPSLSPSPPIQTVHNAPPPPSAAGFRMVLTRRPVTVLRGLISLYDGTEDAPVFGRRRGFGRPPLL